MTFPEAAYLARLGLTGWPSLTAEGLAELVCAQARAICFENLDTLSGQAVDVRLPAIVDKLLGRGRGGYCYELNGLLGAALQAAGFTAHRRLARVAFRRPAAGPRTHLLWLVDLAGETWLADAGFGGPGTFTPIRFAPGLISESAGARFRLTDEGERGLLLQRWIADTWMDVYLVESSPVLDIDIEMANHFTSTWPTSPFRNVFMCYTPSDNGCWGIEGNALVHRDSRFAPVEEHPLRDADELRAALRSHFRLDISPAVADACWRRVQQAKTDQPG